MPDREIGVDIRANDNTKEGVDSAKGSFDNLEEHIDKGVERVAERVLEYFAVDKIKDFALGAVKEFAKIERQFDILGAQVKANGGNWDEAKEKVEDFVKSEETLYGFTREQVIASLTDAETKVHSLTAALKISDEAQKLALVTGQSLQTTTDALSLAYQGNSRGVMELGRLLGMSREQAKDVNLVFSQLAKATKNVGDVAGDTQGKINSFKVEWEDATENVGKQLSTLVPLFGFLERAVSTLFAVLFGGARQVANIAILPFTQLIETIGHVAEAFEGLYKVVTGHFREGFQQIGRSIKGTFSDLKDNVNVAVQDAANSAKEISGIWVKETKKIELITGDQFKKMVIANIDNTKKLEKEAENKAKIAESLAEKEKKAAEKLEKEKERLAKMAADAKIREENRALAATEKLHTEEITFADKSANILIELGKGKNKELVEVAKQAAAAKAIMNTAVAVSQALSDFPYPFSIAMAALVGIEGGLEVAKIEGVELAEGGVVTAPTVATIGEGGEPEAVVPLSKAGSMGFGGGGDTFNVHFNGQTTQSQARSAARAFFSEWQTTKIRAGYRATPF